jgi:hypothetical protein
MVPVHVADELLDALSLLVVQVGDALACLVVEFRKQSLDVFDGVLARTNSSSTVRQNRSHARSQQATREITATHGKLRGKIDAILRDDLIDYKTGSLDPPDARVCIYCGFYIVPRASQSDGGNQEYSLDQTS